MSALPPDRCRLLTTTAEASQKIPRGQSARKMFAVPPIAIELVRCDELTRMGWTGRAPALTATELV
jgi:hypothetical protein